MMIVYEKILIHWVRCLRLILGLEGSQLRMICGCSVPCSALGQDFIGSNGGGGLTQSHRMRVFSMIFSIGSDGHWVKIVTQSKTQGIQGVWIGSDHWVRCSLGHRFDPIPQTRMNACPGIGSTLALRVPPSPPYLPHTPLGGCMVGGEGD